MKVGDLVRVKNWTTGDSSELVKFYRERTPMLLTARRRAFAGSPVEVDISVLLIGDKYIQITSHRLEVISESR
jgi:hypothetical protein